MVQDVSDGKLVLVKGKVFSSASIILRRGADDHMLDEDS